MYNYTSAHFVFLLLFLPLSTTFPLVSVCIFAFSRLFFPILLSVWTLLLQTVQGVETRSSRVSLSWRWRNSGTSAASDVRPATWSSQESTSASESVRRKQTQRNKTLQSVRLWCLIQTWHANTHAGFFMSSFSPDMLNCAFNWADSSSFVFILYVAGMEYHTVRQITTPSTGWNVRPAADTSVEGFWRWEWDQISTWDGVNGDSAAQNSAAIQKSKLGVDWV